MLEKRIQYVVFDFDGTICDSYDAGVDAINRLSTVYGFKPVAKEERQSLRDKSMKAVLSDAGVSMLQVPFIAKAAMSDMRSSMSSLKAFAGLPEILAQLQKAGYRLGILSSNSEENIRLFLNSNGIKGFDFLYSGSSIFGKHRLIFKMMKEKNIKSHEVVYVGDEVRDLEACKKVGIPMVAVAWGYNSKQLLESHDPSYIIDRPDELPSLLGNSFI